MKEDYEILEYEDFLRIGKKQLDGLKEKFQLTGDKEYLKEYKQVEEVLKKGIKLKDYCVPIITEDNQIGTIEFLTKDDARDCYHDAMKEKMYNFI